MVSWPWISTITWCLESSNEWYPQSSNGAQMKRVHSCKFLGVKRDEKWSWKLHIRSLACKLGHRLPVFKGFNRIFHMLDKTSRVAFFNCLVLPHLDYADMVWSDQQGLKSEMDQLQSYQKLNMEQCVEITINSFYTIIRVGVLTWFT